MRTSRGKHLTLTACEDTLESVRLDNHICISDSHLKNSYTTVAVIRKNNWLKLFSKSNDVVLYPVMFTPDVKEDQIYLPPEIATDLTMKPGLKIDIVLDEIRNDEWVDVSKIAFTIQNIRNGKLRDGNIDAQELIESVQSSMSAFGNPFPLHVGQVILIPYHNVLLELRVQNIVPDSFGLRQDKTHYYRLSDSSSISFSNECMKQAKLTGDSIYDENGLSEIPLDFVGMGVGGYKKEIAQIIRTIFYSRANNKSVMAAYGVDKHSKGILLYGPPGTGKTLIAKTVSKLFTKHPAIVVEGPELKNSYYGATQQNLGDLFEKAKKHPNELFVYIFDEIDSLFVVRGSGDSVSTSNNNDLVSRFLSILEGVEALNNVVIIGTTNRKELIDPALLRAGRLETHVYIGLPDEKDRLEILRGHTLKMTQTLAADVDLQEIARLSRNYSGAELARVVNVARGYAMGKNFDTAHDKLVIRADIKTVEQLEKVSQQYFLRALKEVQPMFGVDDAAQIRRQDQFVLYDDSLVEIVENFQQSLNCLKSSKDICQLNFLISGSWGTGKTGLANYLASKSSFPHVQVLSASRLLPEPVSKQIDIIDEIFMRARQSSEPSVILLENIEDLIEASPDYALYNNKLRLKINELLTFAGTLNNKLLVIATTRSQKFIKDIGMAQTFSESATLSNVRLELSSVSRCEAVLKSIASNLGIKMENDLSGSDYSFVDVPIKDLIYQLHKFAAKFSSDSKLYMREFIDNLPQIYKSVRRNEGAVPSNSVNFFRPSVLVDKDFGEKTNVKQNAPQH
ncbi:MAG TPA: ATP-binding protein [Gammaproteobacteria bacterium]|nr:ATP-binding protein [Gammaproteobacteria bacterium]